MGKYFGTDGVRGVANRELTPELAFRLGRCGAYVLTKQAKRPQGAHRSGYALVLRDVGSRPDRRHAFHRL